jgi:hypothetical protein
MRTETRVVLHARLAFINARIYPKLKRVKFSTTELRHVINIPFVGPRTDGCGEVVCTFMQLFVVNATKGVVTSWTRVFIVESEDLLGRLLAEAKRYVGMPLYLGR